MNPELELLLQQAFANVQPTSPAIGRVIVEPDYEASWSEADAVPLAGELTELLRAQQTPDGTRMDVPIPPACTLLTKYVRRILVEKERVEKSWVEVEPPGNWI